MLQEATKLINSAFQGSFIKRLSLYLHDCVREEVKSATFRNLKQDKDNKWIFLEGEEKLFSAPQKSLKMDGSNSELTELMLHAEVSQKERYLLYGYLFLTGKNKRKKREEFLTPLLYTTCKLERDGVNIACSLTDENVSLNTGALAGLIKNEDEEEIDYLFEGLIDVVPELPLNKEKIQIFLTTLKSIIPDLDIENAFTDDSILADTVKTGEEPIEDSQEEVEEAVLNTKTSSVCVTPQASIILTKRPSITAGVLHELTQISEKPSGIFRETVLNVVNQEFTNANQTKEKENRSIKEFLPVTPLELSDSQEDVLKAIEANNLIAVCGPPGTGKSQTIVNLVSHLVANGKTVLVASRMDKAVDVISDRLNSLGAPYLSLRAGRPNYQKQLNFDLQELLSNKVDLDEGFENSILVDVDDMQALINSIHVLENKCEEIIKLEHLWSDALVEFNNLQEYSGETLVISKNLTDSEIASVRALLENFEVGQGGFLAGLLNKINQFKLNKLLGSEFKQDNIGLILQELNLKEIQNRLKSIEAKINKIGNLHVMLQNIRDLRKKQKNLAVDILKKKRREALKDIIRDQVKRQRLIVHSKALVERKKSLQNRLLDEEDFTPLLEAFPCWAVTTYAISESLPLKPGLFDVAIIDEASQCDIASCFPVLFRAKKAVIVGDDKQLPHLSFLEKTKEQSFLSQYNIPDKYQLMWRFRTNSMFDLANYYSTRQVLLDEHFRSLPPIINFSNEEFYGGRIRIMNREMELANTIELNVVDEAKTDLDSTRNMAETEAILKRLQDLIVEDSHHNLENPTTIGIISPFRGQVELIKKAISQVLTESTIRKHQIEVGTAHTFQGDERNIIILSFTLAPNSHFQSLTFLQKPNLFNVAITRARKRLICYISKTPESLPTGLLKNYLEYIREFCANNNSEKLKIEDNFYNNSLEKEIADLCHEEGLEVNAGFESAGFNIDLVISDGENQVAVECDGMEDKTPSKSFKPIHKQTILERCGWRVLRITAREWHYSKKVCVDRIRNLITKI